MFTCNFLEGHLTSLPFLPSCMRPTFMTLKTRWRTPSLNLPPFTVSWKETYASCLTFWLTSCFTFLFISWLIFKGCVTHWTHSQLPVVLYSLYSWVKRVGTATISFKKEEVILFWLQYHGWPLDQTNICCKTKLNFNANIINFHCKSAVFSSAILKTLICDVRRT